MAGKPAGGPHGQVVEALRIGMGLRRLRQAGQMDHMRRPVIRQQAVQLIRVPHVESLDGQPRDGPATAGGGEAGGETVGIRPAQGHQVTPQLPGRAGQKPSLRPDSRRAAVRSS